jgi:3-methyladenine DNA glycosylase AlkD
MKHMSATNPSRPPGLPAILKQLKAAGSEKKRASAIRVGIPMDKAFGVSVGIIRAFAKELKHRHDLAQPLWATGIHEARVLATMLADPRSTRPTDLERWLGDVVSWDLCDHLCGNLVRHRTDAADLVRRWIGSPTLYVRRAAFASIAELAVHDRTMDDDILAEFTQLIVEHSGDGRPHVRQAASWALRSIGKRDGANHDRALAAAAELLETGDASKRWVGRDAMRELESLIKVPQRGRLLSAKSRTGRKQVRRTVRKVAR